MANIAAHALDIGEDYLAAWKRKDLAGIGKFVHPQIQLKSPVTEVTGKEAFLKTCENILAALNDVRIHARFGSDNQAVFIYDFAFKPPLGTIRTANVMTFEGDLIRSVDLIFDARPFEKAAK